MNLYVSLPQVYLYILSLYFNHFVCENDKCSSTLRTNKCRSTLRTNKCWKEIREGPTHNAKELKSGSVVDHLVDNTKVESSRLACIFSGTPPEYSGGAENAAENSSVADPDPGSGIGCLFDPWFRDGRKSASGSGMNNPDHIF